LFIPLKDENPTYTIPVMTIFLILLNGVISIYQLSLSPMENQRLIFQWGAVPYQIIHGEVLHVVPAIPIPLTIFSSMFLHGGFLHLGGNMLYLWIFGNNVEDVLGHLRFLLFYLLCGLFAALTQIFSSPGSTAPMIGASGAIGGVLGAYLVLFPYARILTLFFIFFIARLVYIPAMVVLGFWFLLQFLGLPGAAYSNVAFFAHIGGFVSGMILVKLLQPRWSRRRRR
jgi:membrane associated rhomboid family serine protease